MGFVHRSGWSEAWRGKESGVTEGVGDGDTDTDGTDAQCCSGTAAVNCGKVREGLATILVIVARNTVLGRHWGSFTVDDDIQKICIAGTQAATAEEGAFRA